jgi:hypothetical protein
MMNSLLVVENKLMQKDHRSVLATIPVNPSYIRYYVAHSNKGKSKV